MDIFTAISDPNRRKILEHLASRGQMSATDISKMFDVSLPAISQHLKALKEANLVLMEKQAQKRIYRVNPRAFKNLELWAHNMIQVWEDRFEKLDKLLEKTS